MRSEKKKIYGIELKKKQTWEKVPRSLTAFRGTAYRRVLLPCLKEKKILPSAPNFRLNINENPLSAMGEGGGEKKKWRH